MISLIPAVLSAVSLSLSFSSLNLWLPAWFGFIFLFVSLEKKSLSRSFFTAYLCGVVFWCICVYWLAHVTLLGQAVLILYLAVYFGAFGCLVYLSRRASPAFALFFIPAGWVLLEYARAYLFTGFPWALLGHSQYNNLAVIQFSDITGCWGVSFLLVLVNTGVYLFWRRRLSAKGLLVCICVLFLSLGYGLYRLNYHGRQVPAAGRQVKISVVQGNIPQDLKWDIRASGAILDNYIGLTEEAARENPDLIIWPEASVPFFWGEAAAIEEYRKIFSLAQRADTSLLVGAVSNFGDDYFNSALFVDNLGRPGQIYNKLHLVPFGEFVPLKNVFPFLESIAPIGDIQAGKERTVFSRPAKFSVLICFEDLFPELSRQFIKEGAVFLVNITNDAWYKKSSAPYQHLAASVYRAVENRVYLVRAANTGISGFIAPSGEISSMICEGRGKCVFTRGYAVALIPVVSHSPTFYNRFGDLFVLLCFLFEIWVLIRLAWRRAA